MVSVILVIHERYKHVSTHFSNEINFLYNLYLLLNNNVFKILKCYNFTINKENKYCFEQYLR